MPASAFSLARLRRLGALAGSLLVLAGCGRTMDRAEMVMINGAEPEVLDPAMVTAQATGRVAYAVYEGLTAFSIAAQPEPGVAERWDLSTDGLKYTFHLRPQAVWSNGDPVTADDFVYSWQRTLLPETGCEYASQLYYLKNAQAFNEGKLKDFSQVGAKALDPHTLEVNLEAPTAYFLDLCAFATFLPVHRPTVEKYPNDWSSNPEHFMGNGPFLLKEWRPFDRLRLVRNPRYWNTATVPLSSIDVLPSARPSTAYNLYATGAADLMMDKGLAPSGLIGDLRQKPDFHAAPFLGNYFVRYNVTRPPFNDLRVRLAFSLVFDKEVITKKITRAGELPADSFTPPGTGRGYAPPPGLVKNVARARQLLAEAGYPDGKGFPIVRYLYKGDSDTDRDIAVELQGMLAQGLGVKMELKAQEWTAYLDTQSRLDYDLCRSSWVADYNDPNTFLNMFVTNDGNNRTGWSNDKYDSLIAAAAREVDSAKRYSLFQQAERILCSVEVPICPLYYYVGIQFYDGDKLGGIQPNVLDEHPLKRIFWKQPR